MQIVVPMSGFGERFRRAGYTVPKPLIEVDGRPIIQYVVDMYPGETDFVFICNSEHLATPQYAMAETLSRIAPKGRIVSIAPHKLGPVHAVLEARDHLAATGPVIVNYCDFTCDWDYEDFKRFVAQSQAEGCIPCYRGFHPHTLWSNYYAYVRENQLRAFDIQEKQPFTESPRNEFASSGTYYFASRDLLLTYANRMVEQDLRVGGEYYASLIYKPMFADGRNVMVYELPHFMQWGTPEDLQEYQYWSSAFRKLTGPRRQAAQSGTVMLPMVGLGSRFVAAGYTEAKPLIPVSGQAMALQALNDLPSAPRQTFVVRDDLKGLGRLRSILGDGRPQARFVTLDHMTDGQATTCMEGLEAVDAEGCLTIAACDNGMIYDPDGFEALISDPDVDVIVWGQTGYPGAIRRPQMYGWIDWDPRTGAINGVSVKKPLSEPKSDPIIVGAFTFKRAGDFRRCVERMKAREGRVNGEYYVDTAINDAIALGLRCKVFPIDHYLCWGTPEDLKTFEYWQACFHAWPLHPYSRDHDPHFPAGPSNAATGESVAPTAPAPKTAPPGSDTKRQIATFLAVGTTAVLVDLVSYRLLVALGLMTGPAKMLGFVAGAVFAYFANKRWTFGATGDMRTFSLFSLLYFSTLVLNVSTNEAMLALLGKSEVALQLSFLVATGASTVANFLGMKLLVFRTR